MSETYKKIKQEIIYAMKNKESEKLLALRSLDSLIKNISINNNHREAPTEEDTIQGISQTIKRGSDSAEQFSKANRNDLVETEIFQVNIAKSFLPKQFSKDELKEKIVKEISETYSTIQLTQKDFGKLMKMFGEKFRGLTDNKTISETIKELFSELGVK